MESTAWPTRSSICLQNATWEMLYQCSDKADLNLCPQKEIKLRAKKIGSCQKTCKLCHPRPQLCNEVPLGPGHSKYLIIVYFTTYSLTSPSWITLTKPSWHLSRHVSIFLNLKTTNDSAGKPHLYTEHQFWWLCQYIKNNNKNLFTLDWEWSGRLLLEPQRKGKTH